MASLSSLALRAAPCAWPGPFVGGGGDTSLSQTSHRWSSPALRIQANKSVKKIRQVVLKEDIEGLGKSGEQVKVRAGYFRNYLLPYGKADLVSASMLKEMEMERQRIEAEKLRVKEEAEQLALLLQAVSPFKVRRKPSQGKQIAGSVTPQDVADIIKAQVNRDIAKSNVNVPEISELGEYIVEIKLHEEVSARVRLTVSPS